MQRYFFSVIAIILALLFSETVITRGEVENMFTIATTRGETTLNGVRVSSGSPLPVLGMIITGKESVATLSFDKKLFLALGENTSMRLDAENRMNQASFTLTDGVIRLRRVSSQGGGKLEVRTPTVVVFLSGTTTDEVIVRTRERIFTDIFVVEGKGVLRGLESDEDAPGVSLSAGLMTTVDAKSEATNPRQYISEELPNIEAEYPVPKEKTTPNNAYLVFGIIAFLGILTGILARTLRIKTD